MALVGILSGVSALENTISGSFSSMGANTFNIQRYEFTARRQSSRERQKINPVINYRNIKDFEDNYNFPFTKVGVSFSGTSFSEVKYENTKTDPEVAVIGSNESFIENSGLEIENGRSLNVFDIENSKSFEFEFPDIVASEPTRLKVIVASDAESPTSITSIPAPSIILERV